MANEIERDFRKAKLLDELPDRAKIKWPKKRKFKVVRGGTKTKPKVPRRPSSYQYRDLLEESGKNLYVCERCGRSAKCQVHHKDGNPWNNTPNNLVVLCRRCHEEIHGIDDEGVIDEISLVPLDSSW